MADFDGIIDPPAAWGDVPQMTTEAVLVGGPGGSLNEQPKAIVAQTKFLKQGLDTAVRTASAPVPVNTDRVWLSETGANPENNPIYGRSTPYTATLSVHEHIDRWGGPSRYYKWGVSSWMTNGGIAPMTALCGVGEGWKVRGVEATGRQCGDGGDAHAAEILIGQFAARATVRVQLDSTTVDEFRNHRDGSRFCVGNTITGSLIPAGSTITSVTKDGQTYTGMHVQAANVNNAGQGYQVGDILTRNTGGTFTINPTFEVRSVDAGGGILTVNVLEPGDCSVAPTGSIGVTGGSGTLATFHLELVTAGFAFPDTVEISNPATGTSSNQSIRVRGVDNMNIGLLVTGSGDGGTDESGTANTRGIQFQSYGTSKFLYGVVFGGSAIRAGGTAIYLDGESEADAGMAVRNCQMTYAHSVTGGSYNSPFYAFNNTATNSVFLITGNNAPYGIRFTQSNTFSGAALFLERQNIATDQTVGMQIATTAVQKLGFWGKTPVVRPAALTQTYSTQNRELTAYTPNAQDTAYTGADAAALLVELNQLREAYENLRLHHESLAQFVNALVSDLRSIGFYP